jgi:hypothetical protein
MKDLVFTHKLARMINYYNTANCSDDAPNAEFSNGKKLYAKVDRNLESDQDILALMLNCEQQKCRKLFRHSS